MIYHITCTKKKNNKQALWIKLKCYLLDETLDVVFDNEEVVDAVCSGFREGREIFDTCPGLHRTKS